MYNRLITSSFFFKSSQECIFLIHLIKCIYTCNKLPYCFLLFLSLLFSGVPFVDPHFLDWCIPQIQTYFKMKLKTNYLANHKWKVITHTTVMHPLFCSHLLYPIRKYFFTIFFFIILIWMGFFSYLHVIYKFYFLILFFL